MLFDISSRYKRWRHGRGFGIHSPFAYDFIMLTLRETLPYYAYDMIDTTAVESSGNCLSAKRLRLIFRIAVRFNPASVAVVGESSREALSMVLKSVRKDIKLMKDVGNNVDFVIFNEDLKSSLNPRERAVYIFPDMNRGGAETNGAIWSAVKHGMRFDNSRGMSIIVTSPTLPRQRFDVKY